MLATLCMLHAAMTNASWEENLKLLKEFGGISDEEMTYFLTRSDEHLRSWLAVESIRRLANNPIIVKKQLMERLVGSKHGQGLDPCTIQKIVSEPTRATPLSAERKLTDVLLLSLHWGFHELESTSTRAHHIESYCFPRPPKETTEQATQLGFGPTLAKQMTSEAETIHAVKEVVYHWDGLQRHRRAFHTYAELAGLAVQAGFACTDHIFVLRLEESSRIIVRKDVESAGTTNGCTKHVLYKPDANNNNKKIIKGTLVVREPGSNITVEQVADELIKEAFSSWCYNAADDYNEEAWALGVYGNRVTRVQYLSYNGWGLPLFYSNMASRDINGEVWCTTSYELTTSRDGLVVNEQTLGAVSVILGAFQLAGADLSNFKPRYLTQEAEKGAHSSDSELNQAISAFKLTSPPAQ